MAEIVEEPTFELYVDAPLEKSLKYRLTWTCRPNGVHMIDTKKVEFQLSQSSDSSQAKASPNQHCPARHYLAEILFWDPKSKVWFLSQFLLPCYRREQHDYPAVGFSSDGASLKPPDTRPNSIPDLAKEIFPLDTVKKREPKPEMAMRTNYYREWITPTGEATHAQIGCTDLATKAELPTDLGKPAFTFFGRGAFRFQILAENFVRLRQDETYWKKRTNEILKEVNQLSQTNDRARQWIEEREDNK